MYQFLLQWIRTRSLDRLRLNGEDKLWCNIPVQELLKITSMKFLGEVS